MHDLVKGGWAGIDMTYSGQVRSIFIDGGNIIYAQFDAGDGTRFSGGGNGVILRGIGPCSNMVMAVWHDNNDVSWIKNGFNPQEAIMSPGITGNVTPRDNPTPHNHISFITTEKGLCGIPDDRAWPEPGTNILGDAWGYDVRDVTLYCGASNSSTSNPTTNQSSQAQDVVFPPAEAGMNPSPQLGKVHHFSISAQAAYRTANGVVIDPGYEANVRTYWAFTSPGGRNLALYQTINLQDFEGYIELPPKQLMDTEVVHGPYGSAQGMVNIGIGNGIMGGGACNTNGMQAQVAWYSGLKVKITNNQHPYAPGVEDRFAATVQSGSGSTVFITNPTDVMLYYHWRVSGDDLALWIDNKPGAVGFTPLDTFTGNGSNVTTTTATNEIPIYKVNASFDVNRLMTENTVFQPVTQEEVGDTTPFVAETTTENTTSSEKIPIGTKYQVDKKQGSVLILIVIVLYMLTKKEKKEIDDE